MSLTEGDSGEMDREPVGVELYLLQITFNLVLLNIIVGARLNLPAFAAIVSSVVAKA
jgi:hypothetical protein